MVNTTLTAAGMWALAIPGLGLLSLFVFICSFIPIAGCFISTIPVAFVALTEYGFLKVRSSSSQATTVPHMDVCIPRASSGLCGLPALAKAHVRTCFARMAMTITKLVQRDVLGVLKRAHL